MIRQAPLVRQLHDQGFGHTNIDALFGIKSHGTYSWSLLQNRPLRFNPENPKRPKSAAWRRYARYKKATTLAQFYALGGTAADLWWDVKHGFMKKLGSERRAA